MSGEALAFVYGAVGRWLTYVSVVTIVGTAGATVAIRRAWREGPSERGALVERTILYTALAAALVLLCVTAWRLYAQAYSVFGLDESVTLEHMRVVAFDTAWGRGWVWQIAAAGFATILLALSLRAARVQGILVTAAAATAVVVVPLTGHAMTHEGAVWLSVALQAFHVAGVGLWIGTLLIVMTLLRRTNEETFAAAIRRFSPLAMAAVGTIAVSGVATAIVYLDSLSDLWNGAYGRTLVLKLLLFTAVAAVGGYNARRLLPTLNRPERIRVLNRTASVELVIGAVTLAVTAVLVALPLVHG